MKKILLIILSISCFSIYINGQKKIDVTGVVIERTGMPVIGANVIVKGETNGTITDINGKYSLSNVSDDAVLQFSYLGLKTQDALVNGKSNVDIMMIEDVTVIDEILVTGYISEKKVDITGAISVVKMDDIKNIPTANIMTTLQGRIPGVSVSTSGKPGGTDYSIAVRGITTINDASPLYVIDGVQTRAHMSTILNPNDIESIQILKDAASAAIYGSKAANGVIIITTKHGRKDKMMVDVSAQLSAQVFTNQLDMLNAQQWGEVYWQASKNDGIISPSHPVYGFGENPMIPEFLDIGNNQRASDTDWSKECYQTTLMQNYNITISNGSDRGSSLFGLNYIDDKGTLLFTEFKRFNVRLNSDYNFFDNKVRIGENLNLSRYIESLPPDGIHELIFSQHPLIPVHTEDDNWGGYISGLGDMNNPVRMLEEARDNKSGNWRLLGNAFIEVEPLNQLVIRSNFSIDYRNGYSSSFFPKWKEGDRIINNNSLLVNNNYEYEWIWSNTIAYSFSFGYNSFQALAGVEAKSYRTEYLWGKVTDFLIQDINYRYLSAGSGVHTTGNGATEYSMYSQFGKINYQLYEKYLFSASLRRDSSSRFGAVNNSGFFPSFSTGWRIGKENFMNSLYFLSELKIRASWGRNGNDLIDNEATFSKFYINNDNASYDITGSNNSVESGVIKTRSANTELRWETTEQTNMGIDGSFFKDRLNFSVDYFIKNTDDMLIDRPYIGVIGEGGTYSYNGASLKNQGVEGIISWRNNINDFRYEVSLNISHFRNKITALPEDIYYTWGGGNGLDKSIVGQPINSWLGYKTNGLYKTEEDLNDGINQQGKGLGRIRYVDINDDKVIDEKDKDWLGSANPKVSGGINVAMAYKQFDFSFFLYGMVRDAWNDSKLITDFFQFNLANHGSNLLNAWNENENFHSNIPALTLQDLNNESRGSDYFIENGSFLKLKNIQLGYTLPHQIVDKLRMTNARVYTQAQNLFTLTAYSGVDPEVLGYNYPLSATFTMGINIQF